MAAKTGANEAESWGKEKIEGEGRDVGQRRLQEQIFVRLRQARDGDTYAMAAAVGSLLPMAAVGLPSKGNQSVSSLFFFLPTPPNRFEERKKTTI